MREIALQLYARQIFTFGQARRLANLSVWEFQKLLGQHHVERHYNETDKAIGYRLNRSGLLGNFICNATPLINACGDRTSRYPTSNIRSNYYSSSSLG